MKQLVLYCEGEAAECARELHEASGLAAELRRHYLESVANAARVYIHCATMQKWDALADALDALDKEE